MHAKNAACQSTGHLERSLVKKRSAAENALSASTGIGSILIRLEYAACKNEPRLPVLTEGRRRASRRQRQAVRRRRAAVAGRRRDGSYYIRTTAVESVTRKRCAIRREIQPAGPTAEPAPRKDLPRTSDHEFIQFDRSAVRREWNMHTVAVVDAR
jgi:hypothetical protein